MAGRQHVRAAALLCLGLLGPASPALAFSGEGTAYSGEPWVAIAGPAMPAGLPLPWAAAAGRLQERPS